MITEKELNKLNKILSFWEDFSSAFCPTGRMPAASAEAITFAREYGWLIRTQVDFLRRLKKEWYILFANQLQGKGTLIKSVATKAVFLDECIRVLPKMAYCVYANPLSAPVSQMKRCIGGNLFFLRPNGGADGRGFARRGDDAVEAGGLRELREARDARGDGLGLAEFAPIIIVHAREHGDGDDLRARDALLRRCGMQAVGGRLHHRIAA